jgi:hypothetical protein
LFLGYFLYISNEDCRSGEWIVNIIIHWGVAQNSMSFFLLKFCLSEMIVFEIIGVKLTDNKGGLSIVKYEKKFQEINRIVFRILAVIGVLIALSTLGSLDNAANVTGEESYRYFRWNSASSTLLMVLLFLTAILAIGWKRVFPFNGPLAIIRLVFISNFFL